MTSPWVSLNAQTAARASARPPGRAGSRPDLHFPADSGPLNGTSHSRLARTTPPPQPFSIVEAAPQDAGRPGEVRILMKSSLVIGAGSLITVAGVVFALQGLGYIGGSAMTGVTLWAVAGPIIALAGIAIAVLGIRLRRPAP